MFQRTLMVFLGFVFLTLALTVGYALAGLSGPETSVREAERAFRAGRFSEAVRSLDLAENNLGMSDKSLLQRILRTRAAALSQPEVANFPQALVDLDRLRTLLDGPSLDLENERIELLLRMGKGKEALRASQELATKLPSATTSSRALEMRGEAAQMVYQGLTNDLKADLRQQLPGTAYADSLRALRQHVFRDEDDPRADMARRDFETLLRTHDSPLLHGGKSRALVRDIRLYVVEAQTAFRRALELGGKPYPAYEGLTFALEEAGRDDDVVAASEIYLRRFDHRYTLAAARNAARMHERRERPWAVVELTERVLPEAAWQQRLQRDALHPTLGPLMLHDARALHTLGDAVRLEKLTIKGYEMSKHVKLLPELQLVHGFYLDLQKAFVEALPLIESYCYAPSVQSDVDDYHDGFVEGLELWLKMLTATGASQEKTLPLFRLWTERRPNDPTPHRLRAEYHIARGEGQLAFSHAQNAFARDGRSDELLRLCCQAAALMHGALGHGPEALLEQCIARGTESPTDVSDDLLYLPLAELALKRGALKVAMYCAKRAQGLHAWAISPHLVRADAALASGEPAEAARAMEALLEVHPTSSEALQRLRRARAALALPTTEQLFSTLFDPVLDSALAARLTRFALNRDQMRLLPGLVRCLSESFPLDPESMLLVAEAMERTGRDEQAKLLLARIPELFPKDKQSNAVAARRYLLMAARRGDEAEMRAALLATRRFCAGDVKTLTETATDLMSMGKLEAANTLLEEVIHCTVPPGIRTGKHFLLAGRVALATGRLAAAEEALMAALSFKDGSKATRLLVPLLLALGRKTDAENAWWHESVDDLTSALITIRLGHGKVALPWVSERRKKEPSDLVLACVAVLADPENAELRGTLPEVVALEAISKDMLLDALLLPGIVGLEEQGCARAAELLVKSPKSTTARWLWARAEARAGRSAGAVENLLELAREQPDFVTASDELAWIAVHSTDPKLDRKPILRQVVAAVQRFRDLASPRMLALAARDIAAQIVRDMGIEGPALNVLARVWIDHPEASVAGFSEVQTLVLAHRLEDALALLDSLEKLAPEHERARFLDFWFRCAIQMVQMQPRPEIAVRLVERARAVVANEAPYGCALHFLRMVAAAQRAHGSQPSGPLADQVKEEDRRLLLRQLELFESDRDPSIESALASLRALEEIDGPLPALARCDLLLKKEPGSVPFWVRRAELLERANKPAEAATVLLQLWRYTRDPETLVQAARVVCEEGIPLTPAVRRLEIEAAGPALDSAAGRYARGLLALRLAKYAEAEAGLAGLAERPDGKNLWFRALANLSIPGVEAQIRAEQLLRDLATRYPRSLVARNAGHFALQLAIRE